MFAHRELAALLASKVFYHLGELADSLTYALGAGHLFDVNEDSEFVQTILCKPASTARLSKTGVLGTDLPSWKKIRKGCPP